MKVVYELSVECGCPVDDKGDVYQCFLTSTKPIPVEHILLVVEVYKNTKMFQEHLAESLSRDLFCEVKLIGYHSGIKVTVSA